MSFPLWSEQGTKFVASHIKAAKRVRKVAKSREKAAKLVRLSPIIMMWLINQVKMRDLYSDGLKTGKWLRKQQYFVLSADNKSDRTVGVSSFFVFVSLLMHNI